MRLLVLVAVVAVACGGSTPGPAAIAGCWNYEMRDTSGAVTATGALHLTDTSGDYSLVSSQPLPASGVVFVSQEPNGNVALLLYTSTRLVFDVLIPKVAHPLTGTAVSHSPEQVLAFTANACP